MHWATVSILMVIITDYEFPKGRDGILSQFLGQCLAWSWTVKKAGPRRIDAFELWCWRRLLRVPWTARITMANHSDFILSTLRPQLLPAGLLLSVGNSRRSLVGGTTC